MTELVPATTHLPPIFGGQILPQSLSKLRPVIETAFEAWLNKTESAATRLAYRKDVEQFLAFQGLNPTHVEQMTRMTSDDVTAWRDHLLANGGRSNSDGNLTPASNATVARKITALRSFFSFLQTGGYRGGNPAHPNFVRSPKVSDDGLTPAIPPKPMARLLDAPNTETPVGIRDRAILAVFAYMALRVDELHHINVGNITPDGEHKIIRIKGKGNDTRRGVLPPLATSPVNFWIEQTEIVHDRGGAIVSPYEIATRPRS